MMLMGNGLELDRMPHIAMTYKVLQFPILELDSVAKFLEDTHILAAGEAIVVRALGAGHHDLAGLEDERCRFGVTDADRGGGESLWFVVDIPRMLGDVVEIKHAVDAERRDDVGDPWADACTDAGGDELLVRFLGRKSRIAT